MKEYNVVCFKLIFQLTTKTFLLIKIVDEWLLLKIDWIVNKCYQILLKNTLKPAFSLSYF